MTVGKAIIQMIAISITTAIVDAVIVYLAIRDLNHSNPFLFSSVLTAAGLNYYAFVHARVVLRSWRRALEQSRADREMGVAPTDETTGAFYMPQDLFNCVVLALALGQFVGHTQPEAHSITDTFIKRYLDFYTEDDFLSEAQDCAARTLNWLRGQNLTSGNQILVWLSALSQAAQKYKPNGERKPRRIFNGLRFTSARMPIPDRSNQYFKDLGLYFLSIQFGRISIP